MDKYINKYAIFRFEDFYHSGQDTFQFTKAICIVNSKEIADIYIKFLEKICADQCVEFYYEIITNRYYVAVSNGEMSPKQYFINQNEYEKYVLNEDFVTIDMLNDCKKLDILEEEFIIDVHDINDVKKYIKDGNKDIIITMLNDLFGIKDMK